MCNIGQIQIAAASIGAEKAIPPLKRSGRDLSKVESKPKIAANKVKLINSRKVTRPSTKPIRPASFTSPIPMPPLEIKVNTPKNNRNSTPPIIESKK